jgi:hypothetical protein
MDCKVSMVIKSHLSDAMLEIGSDPEQAGNRIKFVNWLVQMFPDTQERVTEEQLRLLWDEAWHQNKS